MKILTAPQSGSQAGTTASRNRFGQYLRSRATPVQPRTPKQTFKRAAFTQASSSWRQLTAPERDAWNAYASQVQRSDSLGQSYTPTGHELYVGGAISTQDLASQSAAPAILPLYVLQVVGMTYTDPTPGPEALDVNIATTDANNQLIVETSGPLSPGVTSAAAVRQWVSLPDTAENQRNQLYSMNASPVPILAEYKFLFPSPTTGQIIWFRFKEVFVDPTNSSGVSNRLLQTFRLIIA